MTTPEAFRADLLSETDALHAEHPDSYRRFLYAGRAHTALLGDVTGIIGSDVGAVELPEDTAMLAGDDAGWADLVASP